MSACRFNRYLLSVMGMAVAGFLVLGPALAIAQDDKPRVQITVNDDDNGFEIALEDGTVKAADFVRFGERVHIEADEHIVGDIVVIGNELIIEGRVTGDCVVIGGDLEVADYGVVDRGEVVCIAGNLTLGDSSRVDGSVTSVWGDLRQSSSARVDGEISVVDGPGISISPHIIGWSGGNFGSGIWSFFAHLMWVLVLIFLGIMAYYIFPSRMRRLATTVDGRGLVSFLAGLAGWVLWLPVFILLCITLVGIPLALLLLFLTPIMMLVGYLGVAMAVGRKTNRSAGTAAGVGTMLIGVLLLEAGVLLGDFFGAFPSIFEFLGMILSIVGASVIFIAVTMGFGAFLITRFRPEEQIPIAPGAPAPPPPPPPPGQVPYT